MPISFNQIPVNLRAPGVYVEFDNSRAVRGLPGMPYTALLIGQRLAGGTVAELVPTQVTSINQAVEYFGRGSMLARMVASFKANNTFTELVCIALDDNPAGASATGTLTVTGTATSSGTLNLYIGGRRVQVGVASGDVQNSVAAAIVAAVTADLDLPVTAAAVDNVVTLTARHKGEEGNALDVRLNYYIGEEIPAGVAVAIVAMSGGTANPDLSDVITAMGDDWYNLIAMPYTDAANLVLLETELADRWGPTRPIEGHAIAAATGTHAAMSTLGDSRNSPHLSIMATNKSPTPPVEVAAALVGVAAHYGNIDPARPFQTLPVVGMKPPAQSDRFTLAERNLLLLDGMATFTVDAGGRCLVERMMTTYNLNAQGMEDISYQDLNTMLTLGYLRYSFRVRFSTRYPRHKLGNDGTAYGQGQAIITPKVAKAECFSLFRQWEEVALVENFDQFKQDIVVERDQVDPNRLNFLLPPDLVNQFRVAAAQIQFRL